MAHNHTDGQAVETTSPTPLADRSAAGRLLADRLVEFNGRGTLILALPRGGVPVGFEIARRLGAPLDTLNVKKIGAPGNAEYGIGAVGPDLRVRLDQTAMWAAGVSENEIGLDVGLAKQEVERRNRVYRSVPIVDANRVATVIIVDDGLATGVSARVAVATVRDRYRKARVVFAAPVSSQTARGDVAPLVERFVCLAAPAVFESVGEWYADFKQLTDADVLNYLRRANDGLIAPKPDKTTRRISRRPAKK